MRHADAAWVEIISCYGLNLFTNSRSCNFSLTLINSDRCLIFGEVPAEKNDVESVSGRRGRGRRGRRVKHRSWTLPESPL